jgi:sulfate permease, SulP family
VPPGLPAPALPDLADLRNLVLPAVGILVVGYTDTVLTARAFADRSGRPIDANQELLALGAANVGAGLLRGFPISSSGSRTALALASGARSQVYSLVALAAVVTILLAADILYGVLLAIGLSVAEMLHRVARPHDGVLGLVPGLAGMHDVDDYPHATTVPGLVVYRYDSPLFFANAENFHRRALAAVDGQPGPVRWFVLNAEANVEVDSTGLGALDQLRAELTGRGIVFALARVKQDLLDALSAYGLTASIGIERIYPTLPTAVAAYEKWRTGHDA